ncbi:MAG: C25 family cysteine peptidase [Marinilabiliaceae bacterium]|nr:C25 family cysteine peptidase [Marinilabiliaceae bacterium]
MSLFYTGSLYCAGQEAGTNTLRTGLIYHGPGADRIGFSFVSEKAVLRNTAVAGENFFTMEIPGLQYSNQVGKPRIPVKSGLIDLTGKELVNITLKNVKTERVYPAELGYRGKLYPRQEGLTKNQNPQDRPFRIDREIYRSTKAHITDTVSVENLGYIRGRKLALLNISPIIYYPSPNYFDRIISMTIEIETRDINEGKDISQTVFSSKGLISKGLLNYDEKDVTPSFSLSPSHLIILSDTTLREHLRPLVKWKRIKGFRVTELYVGENGLERSFSAIKDTLNYIWNNSDQENPAPDYMIIAGDLNIIPSSDGAGSLSDLYYSEFDGNGDYLPDMFTGRLPARDTTEIKSMVSKILQYERFEFGDTIKHYNEAVLLAGWDAGHQEDMDGHLLYARNYFENSPGTNTYFFPSQSIDSIRTVRYDSLKAILHSGAGFLNYTGHGSPTKWLNGDKTLYSKTDIDALTNTSRYPVIISNACETAAFNTTGNLGASFVKARDKGALAFIGCTVDSYWDEDFWWAVGLSAINDNPQYETSGPGMYDRLFHTHGEPPSDWFTSLGQILYAGNLSVLSSTSGLKRYYWEYYHLLGDPSLTPYIGTPGIFNIDLPDSIPSTLRKLSFTADPFSYVALSDFDTLWDAASVTPSGAISLDIPDIEKDSCLLVISGQNMKPYFKTLFFNTPDTAWLGVTDVNPEDEAGNNNGLAEYSETISFKIDLQNAGEQEATGVYIILESNSKYLDIVSDSVDIGTIPALSETSLSGLFELSVADSLPDLEMAGGSLKVVYNNSSFVRLFDFSLHAPEPSVISSYIDDSQLGNANMKPEPGESFSIVVKITNHGSSACSGNLSLNQASPYLDIPIGTRSTGIINPGDTLLLLFDASLSEATPEAEKINFNVRLDCHPYAVEKTLGFVSGTSIEDFELGDFTAFPWNEAAEYPWQIEEGNAYSNFNSASSNSSLGNNSSSDLKINLNMPLKDTLRFWYRVSSESGYDFFRFMLEEQVMVEASGEKSWQQAVIPLEKGVHKLTWQYKKDYSVSEGEDRAWIDFIQFPEISFIDNDIEVIKILNPFEPSKNYDQEAVRVSLVNLGADTVQSIELSYRLNYDLVINETFYREVFPGDTATLEFFEPADLKEPGEYTIEVFLSEPDGYPDNDSTSFALVSTGIPGIVINSSDFTIGPNPFSDLTFLTANKAVTEIYISLSGITGADYRKYYLPFAEEGQRIEIPGSGLAPGIYWLRIRTAGNNYTYKLIKR